jgi:L-iditol 2-dehydrogenase
MRDEGSVEIKDLVKTPRPRAPCRADHQGRVGPQPFNYSLDPLVQKGVTLRGSLSHNWPIWENVIALLAGGSIDLGPILNRVAALEVWEEVFRQMHDGNIVKGVLKP